MRPISLLPWLHLGHPTRVLRGSNPPDQSPPEVGAKAFSTQVLSSQVIIELLMGDIPNRQIFSSPDFKQALLRYYQIVTCVKSRDMDNFKALLTKYNFTFPTTKLTLQLDSSRQFKPKIPSQGLTIMTKRCCFYQISRNLHLESIHTECHLSEMFFL